MNFFKFILGNKPTYGFFQGIKHILVELFFGVQIADLISDTSSIENTESLRITQGNRTAGEELVKSTGMIANLLSFIPKTFMTNLFEGVIQTTINDKFYKTYNFIQIAGSGRFRAKKENLHLLTTYRVFINTLWTIIEIFTSIILYIISNDLVTSVLATFILEFLRKFKI